MPEKCGLCSLFRAEYPTYCTALIGKRKSVAAPYGMSRPEWCPLVEVKVPHGDLVDIQRLFDEMNHPKSGKTCGELARECLVIEAEGEEE